MTVATRHETSAPGLRLAHVSPRQRTPSLLELAISNLRAQGHSWPAATVKGAQACSTIWQLAYQHDDEGRWPTQEQFAAYWKTPLRSVQRDWSRFRQAFPREADPERIAKLVAIEIERRQLANGPSSVTAARFPQLAAA